MIKFNKHHVTNGVVKARVHYCVDNRVDGRRCVTMYAKDYSDALGVVLGDAYKNDTDFNTDYFDKGRVVLFEDHPLYGAARLRAEKMDPFYLARLGIQAATRQAMNDWNKATPAQRQAALSAAHARAGRVE